jgi:predicted ATPase
MIHLQSLEVRPPAEDVAARFPFTIPAIAALAGKRIVFDTPVTILIGENGSGKSTLLEALAVQIGSYTVGSVEAERDRSLEHVQPLANALALRWAHRTRRGFFMRSEDYFGFARRMQQIREEYQAEVRRIDENPSLSNAARGFAKLPYGRELADMRRLYGDGLESVSHGESFLRLFQSRFVPEGLYLLDEPEAPLSPMRQLALIALVKDCVEAHGAQFILATHSPILMAIPNATLLTVTPDGLVPTIFAECEHVQFTRAFLNAPEQYLKHL